nr:LysR family transcriptional regulator substrate-binding protein [Nocardia cyriacigeorgica]
MPEASSTVAPLTDPFCTRHPLVRVRSETSLRSSDIVDRIRRFELDAGIVYPHGLDIGDLTVAPLYQERLVLASGAELLAGRTDAITWAEALDMPMYLLYRTGHPRRRTEVGADPGADRDRGFGGNRGRAAADSLTRFRLNRPDSSVQ